MSKGIIFLPALFLIVDTMTKKPTRTGGEVRNEVLRGM